MSEKNEYRDVLIDRLTENLPVLRKQLKLSQEKMADLIGASRYTVMLIESRKRKMTWSTFLSLILIFDKNEETSVLLRFFNIYTEDFEALIKPQSRKMDA